MAVAPSGTTVLGSARAARLSKWLLEEKKDVTGTERAHKWDRTSLTQWGLKPQEITDVLSGLAMVAKLNRNNANDTWRDRISLLISGEFHKVHFPPDFFKKTEAGRVDKVMSKWRGASLDVIRDTAQKIKDGAVARQQNKEHAALYVPTELELEALEEAAANRRKLQGKAPLPPTRGGATSTS
jgi:hypothetical protein